MLSQPACLNVPHAVPPGGPDVRHLGPVQFLPRRPVFISLRRPNTANRRLAGRTLTVETASRHPRDTQYMLRGGSYRYPVFVFHDDAAQPVNDTMRGVYGE